MADKYISIQSGIYTEVAGTTSSIGAGDAGKIVALDGAGKLDQTLMPTGVGADTKDIIASETLVAGDIVNIWDNAGAFNVRKADATIYGKQGDGFVLAAVTAGNTAKVYFEGENNQVTGLAVGNVYLSTTPGLVTNTPPSSAGNIVQELGIATSTTSFNFEKARLTVLV